MIDLRQGDCLEVMRTLPDESVHACVTSPPYFGLRDYGHPDQIGLEPTPDAYVAQMVAVFRDVRRVLRNDGTLWLNLGDSYFSTTKGSGGSSTETSPKQAYKGSANGQGFEPRRIDAGDSNCKPKDLIGIPWRVALALQADGWYLRQDIIWHKPNPMPESVTDRCTKAHEYIFLLTKSAKYWYDADALREPHSTTVHRNTSQTDEYAHGFTPEQVAGRKVQRGGKALAYAYADGVPGHPLGRNARTVWTIATNGYPDAHFATFPEELPKRCISAGCPEGGTVLDIFAGSGTTLAVAIRLGRKAIGIELNPEYIELARQRIAAETPSLFAQEGL